MADYVNDFTIQNDITATATPPLLVTIEEAARLLAVCEKTIRNLVAKGTLVKVRIGRAVRLPVTGLQTFIQQQQGK